MRANKPIDERPQKRFLFEKELRRQKAHRIALEAIARAEDGNARKKMPSLREEAKNESQHGVPLNVRWRMEELQGKIDRLRHHIEQLPPEVQEAALPTLFRYVSELRSLKSTPK